MRYKHRKKLQGGVNDTYLQSEERKIYLKERERERERVTGRHTVRKAIEVIEKCRQNEVVCM